MSRELLGFLQREHAFDPAPVRDDLGVYHVPFSELVGDANPEAGLRDACLRCERIALVGDSGSGRSSLTAGVLGPLAEGVAPILVPIARESFEVAREPRAMFAHLVTTIASHAIEAEMLSAADRDQLLAEVASDRPVGRASERARRQAVSHLDGDGPRGGPG